MTILHLPGSAYEGPIRLNTLRTSALTHEAWIRPQDGAALRSVVKIYRPMGASHTRELLNEFVGHYLAERLEFAAPKPVGTITIVRRQWPKLNFWRELPKGTREVVAWWSAKVSSPSIKARFDLEEMEGRHPLFTGIMEKIRAELLASVSAPGIVAFDELIANVDRNVGNLLGPVNERYLLIDHGQCLTGPTWEIADLTTGKSCKNVLRLLLGDDRMPLNFKSAAAAMFDRIQPLWPATIAGLKAELGDLLSSSEVDAVVEFLNDRARRETAGRRMGCIV